MTIGSNALEAAPASRGTNPAAALTIRSEFPPVAPQMLYGDDFARDCARRRPALPLLSPMSSVSEVACAPGGFLDELIPALERVEDVNDVLAARNLYLGDAAQGGPTGTAIDRFADCYRNAPKRREIDRAQLLRHPLVPQLIKSIFDFYFSEDLYGHWRKVEPTILSSGSFFGQDFALPETLKRCVGFALERDWYGYSDSHGRWQTREALAELMGCEFGDSGLFDPSEITVVMGGTAAISSLADYISLRRAERGRGRALCAVPNYPPLVGAVAKRFEVDLHETALVDGEIDLSGLQHAMQAGDYSLVMVQTVVNPWGLRVSERQLEKLVATCSPDCMIILDECHECFGPVGTRSRDVVRPNVIRVNSLSKRLGAPGLKVGWLTASSDFIAGYYEHASTTYGGPPSLFYLLLEIYARFECARVRGRESMAGDLRLFSPEYGLSSITLDAAYREYVDSSAHFSAALRRRRAMTLDRLDSAGYQFVVPRYSNNVFAFEPGASNSYAGYERLVANCGVSVYPGILCMHGSSGGFRVSPCVPEEQLMHGLSCLPRRGRP